MEEIAKLVRKYDGELREGLKTGRTGLFRRPDGDCYVRTQVPLGGRYADETIMIFGDEADLDLFYKSYLA